jgi:hypothetical protein
MISRIRWVGIGVFALLTAASACLAAEPPAGDKGAAPNAAPAIDSTSVPVAKPAPMRGDFVGYGGLGGQFGASDMPSAEDYSKYAQVRMSFAATFRYAFAHSWRWQVSPGYFWVGYSKRSNLAPFQDPNFPTNPYKDEYLTLVVPVSAQVQWLHHSKTFLWHVGAGPGVYRVWVENFRKIVPDPITFDLHKGVYWGGTAEIGAEYFLHTLTTTSIEVTLDGHYVNAKRDDQFPSGFNSSLVGLGLRIGANYYFNLHHTAEKPAAPPLPETTKH